MAHVGGDHQKRMRSVTLNVLGIVGLGEACRLRQLEMEQDEKKIALYHNQNIRPVIGE